MTVKEAQNHTYKVFTLRKKLEELSKVQVIVDCPKCSSKMEVTGVEYETYPAKLEIICTACDHEDTIYSSEI